MGSRINQQVLKISPMNVAVIGAGNLATNLAVALKKAGHSITSVFSRTTESAKSLADIVGTVYTTDLNEIPCDSDIYIIAVKDDAVQQMARKLKKIVPQALIVHTAGSIPADIIPEGRIGVFYPMQTFSKQRIVDFKQIPVFIEADSEKDLDIIRDLASTLSERVTEANSQQRKVLHLAAVFCCNFANHCAAMSEKILKHYDISFDVMLPLINETMAKINNMSPLKAQTGPAIRNDHTVMDAHLELLKQMNEPQLAQIYKLLSDNIHSFHL